MARIRYTEQQVRAILAEGLSIKKTCKANRITTQTVVNWRHNYGRDGTKPFVNTRPRPAAMRKAPRGFVGAGENETDYKCWERTLKGWLRVAKDKEPGTAQGS
jgi:hypothetical protein